MKTLIIDGKTYTKASDLAKNLGYTNDYVGQLCRAEKIDAHLVGRSWYASADSIKDHKSNRYRSTTTKSKQTVKKTFREFGS